MLRLRSVLISSEDPRPLITFYEKILGKPRFSETNEGFVGFNTGDDGAIVIGPHSEVKGRNEMPGRILFFLETEDVEGEYKRIKDLGVPVARELYEPGPPGMKLATFEDPDGNYFQLSSIFRMED